MNLDEVTEVWRSKDVSQLYGVDKTLLHQVLRLEQAKRDKQQRRARLVGYAGGLVLLVTSGLFFAIMLDPNQPETFSARVTSWDYVVGIVGVTAAIVLVGALRAARRSRQAREQEFGDSLRDHLRRRIAELDADATGERRLALIIVAAGWISAVAISILSDRIKHEPVPWNEMAWPSPLATVLILGGTYLLLFRWIPRVQRGNLQHRRRLEALLTELEGS